MSTRSRPRPMPSETLSFITWFFISAEMKQQVIKLKVALGIGRGRDRVLTCDLTKEYVAINGDYRS